MLEAKVENESKQCQVTTHNTNYYNFSYDLKVHNSVNGTKCVHYETLMLFKLT